MRVAGSLYLGPDRSGVRWLLDPCTPGLAGLPRALCPSVETGRVCA